MTEHEAQQGVDRSGLDREAYVIDCNRGADFIDELGNCVADRAAAEGELTPAVVQIGGQCGQALVQPPA